jgi:uncharacterized RDD family membrane protein YckC
MEENILDDAYIEKDELKVAKFWPRFLASCLDGLLLFGLEYLIGWYNPSFNESSLHISSFIYLLYKPMLEYLFGATLGKMVFGMKVVDYAGNPPNFSSILLRNILGISSSLSEILSSIFWFQSFLTSKIFSFDTFQIPFQSLTLSAMALSVLTIVDVTVFVFNNKNQALHDIIAKTLVVKK